MSISVSVGDMTYNAQILGSVQHGTRVGRGRGRGISGGGGWCCLAGRGGGRDAVGGREGNRSHCVGVAWVGGVCHGASCVRYIYTKSGQVATCRLQDAGYSMVWGEGRGGQRGAWASSHSHSTAPHGSGPRQYSSPDDRMPLSLRGAGQNVGAARRSSGPAPRTASHRGAPRIGREIPIARCFRSVPPSCQAQAGHVEATALHCAALHNGRARSA